MRSTAALMKPHRRECLCYMERYSVAELRILVGTMTGTAEAVAKDIQDVLGKAGHRSEIVLMDGRDARVFDVLRRGKVWLART